MSKFLLFIGEHYYPNGGIDDLQAVTDTLEDARAFVDGCVAAPGNEHTEFWAQVVEVDRDKFRLAAFFDKKWLTDAELKERRDNASDLNESEVVENYVHPEKRLAELEAVATRNAECERKKAAEIAWDEYIRTAGTDEQYIARKKLIDLGEISNQNQGDEKQ
jgi:hypothetical protein